MNDSDIGNGCLFILGVIVFISFLESLPIIFTGICIYFVGKLILLGISKLLRSRPSSSSKPPQSSTQNTPATDNTCIIGDSDEPIEVIIDPRPKRKNQTNYGRIIQNKKRGCKEFDNRS